MNLYVLRHALALERNEWKKADSDRPLTKEGIKKMKRAAKGLKHLNPEIHWIITSPFRRAYDTAMIVAKELKLKKNVRIFKSLAPDGDPKALMRHLALNFRSWESIMIVGHEPYLGQLMDVLALGEKNHAFALEKGGLAKLAAHSLTYGKCVDIEWLLTPKILKNLS